MEGTRTEAVRNMPEADYFADPALSQSSLKIIGELSPQHFKDRQEGEDEENHALLIGTAFDMKSTDPEAFAKAIIVRPAEHTSYRTKAAKAWRAAVRAEGKLPVTPKDAADLSRMLAGAMRCKEARELMSMGENQVSVFAELTTDARGFSGVGVPCKGRIDRVPSRILPKFGRALADIKTARSAHPKEWGKAVLEHGYHIQAAWYLDLWNEINPEDRRHGFYHLVVEKTAPFPCVVYELPQAIIDAGRREYARLLSIYARCVRDNVWPGYGDNGIAQPLFNEYQLRQLGVERETEQTPAQATREATLDQLLK